MNKNFDRNTFSFFKEHPGRRFLLTLIIARYEDKHNIFFEKKFGDKKLRKKKFL